MKLIAVRPKNYRRIVLEAIKRLDAPRVFADKKEVTDFSDRGPLTQTKLRQCTDFLVRDGRQRVLGFHDHPDEMWISESHNDLTEYCEDMGWLTIES
ncbi:MAG: hypothetical protein ACIAXF_07055 [Phycisphaerales bacterium JB063]